MMWTSPAVFEDNVVIGTTNTTHGFIYCINKKSGLLVWETGVYTRDEYDLLIPETIYKSSPTIANGRIFVGGWARPTKPSHLFCFNLSNGEQLWAHQVMRYVYSSPAVSNGKVIVGSGYRVYCLSEADGSEIWTYATGDPIGRSSPTVVDGRVFIGSYDQNLYCLSEEKGEKIWNYTCSSWIGSSPAVADGTVYIASEDGNVYCLNSRTGNEIWTYPAIYQVTSSPSVAGELVFISSANIYGGLQALNKTNGELLWRYMPSGSPPQGSSAVIANGKIFESFLGKICCIGSPYTLTISTNFKDNEGNSLIISPSKWSILTPNGTILNSTSQNYTIPYAINGNYSIVSIIWQGHEVIPDNQPITYVSEDYNWTSEINCKLPTQISVDLETSTSLVGFWVNITNRLADYNNNSLTNAQIHYTYSSTGSEPWNTITSGTTNTNGSFSALWFPTATGNFVIKAQFLDNTTYPSSNSTINLAVLPYEAKNIFSIVSNSSISALTFDSSNLKLKFSATGPNQTTGFVKAIIAKEMMDDPANFRVSLNGKKIEFEISSTEDAHILQFTYSHSTHSFIINLGSSGTPSFDPSNEEPEEPEQSEEPTESEQPAESPLISTEVAIVTIVAVVVFLVIFYVLRKRKKQSV